MINESETLKLLSVLKAQYQHKFVIDKMTTGVWKELLNQSPAIPYAAAHQAAMIWMRDNEWPPQVKDLRDILADQLCGIPNAQVAWKQLWDWLKAGYPGMPDTRPPLPALIAESVREIGGTSMVRQTEHPEKMLDRFTRAYDRRRRDQVLVTDIGAAWNALDNGPAIDEPHLTALPRKAS